MTAAFEALLPGGPSPQALGDVPPLAPFAPAAIAFVDALSVALMREPRARAWPELTALAFWMRKANVTRLRDSVQRRHGDALLVPRGTVFHIAPSNVDTIFVYSWFLSLLTGNRNIVRLSRKPSPQADLLVAAITRLLDAPEHDAILRRSALVRYAPDPQTTALLSACCDVRVVWGGNDSVQQIRSVPLPPAAVDVAFASKYSCALIGVDAWLAAPDAQREAWVEAFHNDSYWFDQMACSSPRLVLWLGGHAAARRAATDFWARVEARLAERPRRFGDADYVNKLVAANSIAIEADADFPVARSNDLVRVWLDEPALFDQHHCGAGLFLEARLETLDDLRPLLNRRVQTVSYAGLDASAWRRFVTDTPPAGIDRVVPFGHALDFAPVWDGFDLPRVFMREITVS